MNLFEPDGVNPLAEWRALARAWPRITSAKDALELRRAGLLMRIPLTAFVVERSPELFDDECGILMGIIRPGGYSFEADLLAEWKVEYAECLRIGKFRMLGMDFVRAKE